MFLKVSVYWLPLKNWSYSYNVCVRLYRLDCRTSSSPLEDCICCSQEKRNEKVSNTNSNINLGQDVAIKREGK